MTKSRQEWAQMIRKTHGLGMTARMVGQSLALDFANQQTGQCNPGRELLAAHMGVSESTVKRALTELKRAGLLGFTTKTGPGLTVSYTLLGLSSVVEFAPREHTSTGQHRPVSTPETGVKSERNEGQYCAPPYKGRNQVKNQSARATGACPVWQRVLIKPDSHGECAWNKWLADRSDPTVAELGIRHSDQTGAGWGMPFSMPPRNDDEAETRITEKFLNWAIGRMIERKSA